MCDDCPKDRGSRFPQDVIINPQDYVSLNQKTQSREYESIQMLILPFCFLFLSGKASFESKHFSGKLVIKSKQSQHKVVIPYVAHVLEGGLEFNASVTQYCSDLGLNLGVRNFTVKNAFKMPVALVNVSLPKEAQAHFMVRKC